MATLIWPKLKPFTLLLSTLLLSFPYGLYRISMNKMEQLLPKTGHIHENHATICASWLYPLWNCPLSLSCLHCPGTGRGSFPNWCMNLMDSLLTLFKGPFRVIFIFFAIPAWQTSSGLVPRGYTRKQNGMEALGGRTSASLPALLLPLDGSNTKALVQSSSTGH